jgi:ABC-type uncharacterized transport system auxiliary subunit
MSRVGLIILGSAVLAGCLFRNTSAPPRVFAPVSAVTDDDPGNDLSATAPKAAIQLRAVTGTAFLSARIVWRVSAVEYGQYGTRLWSELPATYVQRALAAALRRTPGLRLTDDVHAPALRVEVLAFDEVLAPIHTATVSLAALLRDRAGARLLDRTFTSAAPIDGDDPATMAQAMGQALDEATAAVAAAAAAALHAH